MTNQHSCCDLKCFGNVTIITVDLYVITGVICSNFRDDQPVADLTAEHCKADCDGKGSDFVTVQLISPLLKIPGGGPPAQVQPYFVVGDIVRVNLDQIQTVGPVNVM